MPSIFDPPGAPSAAPSVTMRGFDDIDATRTAILDNVLKATQQIEPVTNPRYTLALSNVKYVGPERYSLADQKKAVLSNQTLHRRLQGTWQLNDTASGKPLAARTATLAHVPWMTDRGTFIHNGSEYAISNQFRLLPGVFARRKANGELESHVNVSKGLGHRLHYDPESNVFHAEFGQARIPLFPLLKTLGVSDAQLREAWGNDTTAANMAKDDPQAIRKLYAKLLRYGTDTDDLTKKAAIAKAIGAMELDPEVTRRTLGKPHKNVSADVLLSATKKLLAINRGEAEEDDRDHLAYQRVLGPEDLFAESIQRARGVARNLLWKASAQGNLDRTPPGAYTHAITDTLLSSGLGSPLEEVNPAEILDQRTRITRMGRGGIPSLDAVPDSSRAVHPSQYGFVDYLRTPESSKVGVDLRLARSTMKGSDGRIYIKVRDLQTNQLVAKSPQDLADETIAVPGELESGRPFVGALASGKQRVVPRHRVRYGLTSGEDVFSALGNMVPMKSAVKGQRAVMAARMLTQALPLTDPEAPLVQSGIPNQKDQSYEHEYGAHLGAIRYGLDGPGRVHSVDNGSIVVEGGDGRRQTIELHQHMPLNRKTFFHQDPVVRPGDTVQPGQLLARSNFTDQAGAAALGKNARVAYIPWGGLNFEDARVVSESFAKRMCFDIETEILTARGWLQRKLLTLQDEVAILDDGRLIYERPTAIHDYTANETVRATGEQLDICVTPEHALWLSPAKKYAYRRVRAIDAIGHSLRLCRTAQNTLPDQEFFELPATIKRGNIGSGKMGRRADRTVPPMRIPMDDWCVLFGLYIAEGWCDDPAKYTSTSVFIKQCKPRVRAVLAELSLRLGFGKLSSDYRWIWSCCQAVRYLRPLGKALTKRLPTWVWQLSQRQSRLLLRGLMLGDGATQTTSRGSGSYYTSSPGLADDVQRLSLHCGYAANIYKTPPPKKWPRYKGRKISTKNQAYRVAIIGPHSQPHLNHGATARLQVIAHAAIPVWCVTTRTGVVYVRRSGKARWCGNSSEHMYQHSVEWDDRSKRGKAAFTALFPAKYPKTVLHNFDDHGVVKEGTQVDFGSPLILVAREQEPRKGMVHRSHGPSFRDESVAWDHHSPGVVTDVVHTDKGVSVVVKTAAEMQVGDKMAGRHGNKGVVAAIVPDHEMPTDEQGRPFEVLLNPGEINSRTNPAQIHEAGLGKIAAATGKPYKVQDFSGVDDLGEYVEKELRTAGMPAREAVVDPKTGRKIPDVFTGNSWLMKLHHTSESKHQGRGLGSYTADETPAKGGPEGAKRVGMLELNSLLSHGATDVVRDINLVRGQANPQYWSQYMAGFKPPTPKVPHVYQKFVNQLKGSGINVVRDNHRINIMALREGDLAELTGDRELKNVETVDWRDFLKPIDGGLFDQRLTGGPGGNRWSHISLHQPLPNPVMEEPIRRLLNLTTPQFNDILAGKEQLNGDTGPSAISKALDQLDLPKELERARMEIKGARRTARDQAIRRLKYLKSAEQSGTHPREWMLSKVPVLPPAFRPVSTIGPKKLPLVADPNYLYKEAFEANRVWQDVSKEIGDAGDEQLTTYRAFKAVTGLGDPIQPKNQERHVRGILQHVFGNSPKTGALQYRLLGRPVDLVGRAVIAPDPDLDMDQVGVPENRAWEIYRPFVVRHLVRRGMPRVQAARAAEARSQDARQALLQEMEARPVIINRAPTLHRYGVMAAWPRLVKGDVLKISPLVVKGFNADFDGDAMQFHVPASDDAVQEAVAKMMPSRNLFAVRDFRVHALPSNEYIGGLYEASARTDKDKPPHVFATKADAIKAYRQGQITVGQHVTIVGS